MHLAIAKGLPQSNAINVTGIFEQSMTLDDLIEWKTYILREGEVLRMTVRSTVPTDSQIISL